MVAELGRSKYRMYRDLLSEWGCLTQASGVKVKGATQMRLNISLRYTFWMCIATYLNQIIFIGLRSCKDYYKQPGGVVGVNERGHLGVSFFSWVDMCWGNGLWGEVG